MNVVGLYRHFKGEYYFVLNVVRNEKDGVFYMQYLNVLHPEYGYFVRPFSEFSEEVLDREDNVTGQLHRFERVVSLNDGIKNYSTTHLLNELAGRKDSPFQEADIEGLSDLVVCSDYCVGRFYEEDDDHSKGVETIVVLDTMEEAFEYMRRNHVRGGEVFKRTFLRTG